MATIDFVVKNGLVVNEDVLIKDTTDSSGKDSGALIVEGGVGIEKKLYVGTDAVIGSDLAVNGGDITTTQTTFNLVNATATTVNFAGAATDVQIGAATGTTNVNNNLDVDGDVNIDGGDLTVSTSTFNLANTTATTVNFAGAATTVEIGAATGTTNINNNLDVDGDVNIDGGDLTVSTSTFNLANTTATTVNAFGAATTVEIGAATGTTNVNNNLDVDGDVNIDGGDLTVSTSTFNLVDTTATTVNFAGAATTGNFGYDGSAASTTNISTGATAAATIKTLNLATGGAASSTSNINIGSSNGGTTTINSPSTVASGDLAVNGGDITTNQTTFNLVNATATTVNFAGAGTTIEIGAATGTTNINNNLDVDGDVNIDGGDLTVSTSTFNLANTTATTLNLAGAATSIVMGTTSGTTNIRHNLDVDLDVNIDGGDLTTSAATFNLVNSTATTVNFAGAATSIVMGTTSGTTNIRHNLDVDLDVNIDGGDLTTSASTFNLINANATTVNFAGAGTSIGIGATTGTTTVKNSLAVNGNTTLGDAVSDSVTINAGTLSTPNTITFGIDDATTAGISYPVKLQHTTTGTPALGIGTGIQFITETAATNNEVGMEINAVTTDVTATSEDFDFVLSLMTNGATAAEKLRVTSAGNMTLVGDFTVSGGDIVTAAGTNSTLYNTTTTGNVTIYGAQTTGAFVLGGTGGTGAITLGQSTGAQTVNIATGATTSGTTKTVNIGTNGVSGSTTNINIGSSAGSGTVTFNDVIKSSLVGGVDGIEFATNDVYTSMRVIRNNGSANQDGMYIGYQNTGSASTKLFGGGSGTVSLTINANSVNSTSTTTGSAVVNGGLGVANRASAGAFYSSSGESQVLLKDATAGTYLGVGLADGTSGWSLSTNCIGIKMDSTTYSAMGMAGSNGILYWARTATANGTMNSFLEVDNTRKFYLPTNISSTSTTTGSLVVNGGTGIAGSLFTGAGVTNASGSVLRQRYNSTDDYNAELGWQHLQLGNNGSNYIIGGRTATGGSLVFVTNQTNSGTSGGLPTINGLTVLTLASGGTATFGSSSAVQISVDTTDALDFTSNSTNDARGISFNGRTAVSADYNDGYLRLNNQSEFSNGVYIPNYLGIGAGADTSYKMTLGSSTDAKIVLSESSNPYIRFRESTTDRYYMQWNATLNAMVFYNQETRDHYIDTASTSEIALKLSTAGTVRGWLYASSSNHVGILDEGGSWAIQHINDSHTAFHDAGENMFNIGVGGVTGDYGSVCTAGSGKNSWEGYSINGRCVFMHDGGNDWGIYDDVNNQWMIYGQGFGTTRYVDLRYNGAVRLSTNSVGVDVNGLLTATTKSFLIDHPTKEGMKLQYACLEGPENGVYVRGKLDNEAVIELPDYWLGLVHSDSITVNLTPNGPGQQLYVDRIEDNRVYVVNETGKAIKCFYTVYGERKDVDNLKVEIDA